MKKQYRKYTAIKCKECGNEIMVRNDYLEKHPLICRSCQMRKKWNNASFREKCTSHHVGHIPSTRLERGEASFNMLYKAYLASAKKRGHEFVIEKEHFRALTRQDCFYCGQSPAGVYKAGKKRVFGDYIYNGVDRLNPALGYIDGNVVPCCASCNYAKQGLNYEEFICLVKKIFSRHSPENTIADK